MRGSDSFFSAYRYEAACSRLPPLFSFISLSPCNDLINVYPCPIPSTLGVAHAAYTYIYSGTDVQAYNSGDPPARRQHGEHARGAS